MKILYVRKNFLTIIVLTIFSALGLNAQVPEYHYGNGTGSNVFPLNTSSSNKVQWLYPVSEFNTPPPPAGQITKIYLKRSNASTNPSVYQNLTIKLGEIPTTMTQFPNATFWTTGMVEVMSAASYSVPGSPLDSWIEFELDVPFAYDGMSNLVLEISQTSYSNGISLRNVGSGTTNRRIWGPVGNTSGTVGTGPVDFGFEMTYGVLDIGIEDSNIESEICYGVPQDVDLTIMNYGDFQVSNFQVGWSINNVLQTPYNFTEFLDTIGGTLSHSVDVTLPGVDFPEGSSEVKFWTYLPNNEDDEEPINDTLSANVLAKSYLSTLDEVLCEGDTLFVGNQYFTSPLIDHEVILTSVDGCDSVVVVNLDFGPEIVFDWDGTIGGMCEGEEGYIIYGHPNAAIYSWSTGATTDSIIVNTSGIYSVVAQDADQICTATASMEVIVYTFPTFGSWEITDLGNSKYQFQVHNPVHTTGYYWDFGDGNSSTLQDPIHQYTTSGVHTVTLTLSNICEESSFEKVLNVPVDIDELEKGNKVLTVYPNPAKDILEVSLDHKQDHISQYKVWDTQGRLVLEENNVNQSTIQINVEELAVGAYFLEVVSNDYSIKQTFLRAK